MYAGPPSEARAATPEASRARTNFTFTGWSSDTGLGVGDPGTFLNCEWAYSALCVVPERAQTQEELSHLPLTGAGSLSLLPFGNRLEGCERGCGGELLDKKLDMFALTADRRILGLV
jgi:hypothetical protein